MYVARGLRIERADGTAYSSHRFDRRDRGIRISIVNPLSGAHDKQRDQETNFVIQIAAMERSEENMKS